MGFARGFMLVAVSVLLFISLLGVNSFFIISSSLSYDNVNKQIKSIVFEKDLLSELLPDLEGTENINIDTFNLSEEQENSILEEARKYCGNETGEYIINYEKYSISIPCSEIEKGGVQTIINETVDGFIEEIYYGDYDCNYWDCFTKEKTPLFLISEKSKDYWHEKLVLMFLVSLALIVLMFFLVEQKQNFPIILGGVVIVSALPLVGIEGLILGVFGSFASIFTSVLTNIKSMFWFSLIFGLILIGTGIAWRLWAPDDLKKKFSKKDIKKMANDKK